MAINNCITYDLGFISCPSAPGGVSLSQVEFFLTSPNSSVVTIYFDLYTDGSSSPTISDSISIAIGDAYAIRDYGCGPGGLGISIDNVVITNITPASDFNYFYVDCTAGIPTLTPTPTPTLTPTLSNTPTNTPTSSNVATSTPTPTLTSTPTLTPTLTKTQAPIATQTPTRTQVATRTPTPTPTLTPTLTLTRTPTLTPTIPTDNYSDIVSGCCDGKQYQLVNYNTKNANYVIGSTIVVSPGNNCYTVIKRTREKYDILNVSQGIQIINDCNSKECQPCYTPSESGETKNDCTIVTILPLGITCNGKNPSVFEASDGIISVNITGGTAPYNVLWTTPDVVVLTGQTQFNQPNGTYTVTVYDYWYDLSAQTTCTIYTAKDCTYDADIQQIFPTQTPTLTPTPTRTPTPTPSTPSSPVVSCLDGLIIEALYIHTQADYDLLPVQYRTKVNENGVVTPNLTSITSWPGQGGHTCDRAFFEIYGNGVYMMDVLNNNVGGNTGSITQSGRKVCTDYRNVPSGITGTWTGGIYSRYSRQVISQTQAQAIAAAGNGNTINLTIVSAMVTNNDYTCGSSPHSNLTWVRITRSNGQILYNDCPQNNRIASLNVCQVPCNCPPGFTVVGTSTQSCQKLETTSPAVVSALTPGDGVPNTGAYGVFGTLIYNVGGYNVSGNSINGTYAFNGAKSTSPIPGGITNSVSNFWGGRMNSCIIWANNNPCWPGTTNGNSCNPTGLNVPPYPGTLSLCSTINVPSTKTYYIGIAGDNYTTIKIDSNIIIQQVDPTTTSNPTYNFEFWHIYPVTLTAGQHTIELSCTNVGLIGGYAAEIYDNTLSQLTNTTSTSSLNILFSTSSFKNGGVNYGQGFCTNYSCPSGYNYNPSTQLCEKIINASCSQI